MSKKSKKALALIPARGGSKRIPRKNIRHFCGKPMISYPIELACQSGCFSETMVSTDDEEIAWLARVYGANVPFMRSAKTSDDYATTSDVIMEVLKEYMKLNQDFTYCCCIYPGTPLLDEFVIQQGLEMLKNTDATLVLPVVRYSHPIQRSFGIAQDGTLNYVWPEYTNTRTQDLEPRYHDAGQFYWFKVEPFLQTGSLIGNGKTLPLEMPESKVQDIDTEEDWKMAEWKYRFIKQ